ncbi:hypothetical protein SPRG_12027 [Saprolegnia parasitica CBS 223.65]|uniref:Uncharacterized protein n=1 Tax=Saprolegnia parasitica (strain CBS 223.65) TaxID=695850 RepID=A0A067C193_SAPPC|nr:hypothetical protein SPRG_12027 [Saprolegnia parasitica CBS 223.65]KDO22890.1 hypothetical protein SPRG_12027 [Saprolegnia parasitica CBS 223.65]|eukprot:XP_012206445.1 hypothetical protein SPRG_12027 [Saprolegnia parasitica CBS 223.65]
MSSTQARNVTIELNDDQSALTLRVRFTLPCSDVQKLAINYRLAYEVVSLSTFTNYLSFPPSADPLPTIVQVCLALKYFTQLMGIAHLLEKSAVHIWSLWLRFDTITEIGFVLPDKGPTAIALTDGENLHAWFTLRNGVQEATSMYTYMLSVFIGVALLQFGCTVAGILFYCISGSAPLPTYFLLVIGLLGSLSTLAMLVPLAAALDIQRNHSVMLRKHLLELEFQRRKAQLQDDATTLDERIAMFETVIDAIEHNDDRLAFFGIEISLARLATLSATLVSLLSFVVFRAVPITWSDLNSFNIVRPEIAFGLGSRNDSDPDDHRARQTPLPTSPRSTRRQDSGNTMGTESTMGWKLYPDGKMGNMTAGDFDVYMAKMMERNRDVAEHEYHQTYQASQGYRQNPIQLPSFAHLKPIDFEKVEEDVGRVARTTHILCVN